MPLEKKKMKGICHSFIHTLKKLYKEHKKIKKSANFIILVPYPNLLFSTKMCVVCSRARIFLEHLR